MKVLLHSCCGPCSSACAPRLKALGHEVTLFYSNSNIDTLAEFGLRFESVCRLAEADGIDVVMDGYRHGDWLAKVASGLEDAPEKGARCAKCYCYNLERTARYALENGYDAFATSLTVSPHKPSVVIFLKGTEVEDALREALGDAPVFLKEDFKKKEGFKLSVERAKELGLYRQGYCGCEFSKRT